MEPQLPCEAARSCPAYASTELRFDGATESVGTVEVLSLQVDAYCVGFLWAHVVHHEGAVNAAQLVGNLGSECNRGKPGSE